MLPRISSLLCWYKLLFLTVEKTSGYIFIGLHVRNIIRLNFHPTVLLLSEEKTSSVICEGLALKDVNLCRLFLLILLLESILAFLFLGLSKGLLRLKMKAPSKHII